MVCVPRHPTSVAKGRARTDHGAWREDRFSRPNIPGKVCRGRTQGVRRTNTRQDTPQDAISSAPEHWHASRRPRPRVSSRRPSHDVGMSLSAPSHVPPDVGDRWRLWRPNCRPPCHGRGPLTRRGALGALGARIARLKEAFPAFRRRLSVVGSGGGDWGREACLAGRRPPRADAVIPPRLGRRHGA